MPELLGILIVVIVGGLLGFLADAAFPGEILFSWFGAIIVTIIGALVGTIFLDFGPQVFGLDLLPAVVGAVVFLVLYELLLRLIVRRA